jgi:CheY-like chemotaxis protein
VSSVGVEPNDFEAFRESLREALYHLQDPNFVPAQALYKVMDVAPETGPGSLQSRVIEAVRQLEPERDMPQDGRASLHFRSLHYRFINGLTQEETAELMHMSVRNVQRVQGEAIHVLARHLWTRTPQDESQTNRMQAPDWQTQTNLEIRSLDIHAPDAQANVSEVVQSVVDLEAALAGGRGVEISAGYVQADLTAMVHPSLLRQTLITSIASVARYVSSPEMTIYATLEDGQVKITLTGVISDRALPPESTLLADIIKPATAAVTFRQRDNLIFAQIALPIVGERTVLVIEDNPDMVYFYRRCTAGTPYRIVHGPATQQIFDVIERVKPHAIILDVMLPDMDGWQLLTHLSESMTTRTIPVLVCSVVKEENLALALGATAYLSKPVHPHQVVEALDQALLQAPSRAVTARGSSAITS